MITHQLLGRVDFSTNESLRDFLGVRSKNNSTYIIKALAVSIAAICTTNFISHSIITNTSNTSTTSEVQSTNLQENDITLNDNSLPISGISEYMYEATHNADIVSVEKEYPLVQKELNLEPIEEYMPTSYSLDEFNFDTIGYVTTKLNVRENPTIKADKIGMLTYNDKVYYQKISDKWVAFNYNGQVAFLAFEYLSDTELKYNTMSVYGDKRKSFMDYTTITLKSSPQYKLQLQAITDECGLRKVNDRYLVAVGSYYSSNVGQYLDIVLSNGTVIPCIVGDCKQDAHTNENHSVGADGGVVEFIVETHKLNSESRRQGNVSYSNEGWNASVSEVHVYDIDLL